MKKVKNVTAILLVMALTIVLGGCQDKKDGQKESQTDNSSQEATGEPVMGGSIVVGIPQDLEDSLDPHKSVAAGTKEVLFNIYEGLVKPDEEGNYTDAVAESHEISEDGKVYTFALRENVKFHDGYKEYWDTEHQAYLDEVTFKIVGDSNAIVTGLKGGSIDMYPRVNSTQSAQLRDDQDLNILEGGMNLVQALYLNNDEKPFDDVKVRQALCYAVNRQEVLDMMADGKGTIIGSSMFPAFEKYYMPELAEKYEQDIQKAKELLKEAGYPDGFEMTITVPNNYQQHIDTAQVLSEQLKQVGIQAEIQLIEWDSWLSDVYSDRKYQSTVVGVDAAYLSGRALLERFCSDADKNFINYKNQEYDALYEQVKKSTDEKEQIQLYKEMETLLCEDAANVYIQDMASEVVLRKGYGGNL